MNTRKNWGTGRANLVPLGLLTILSIALVGCWSTQTPTEAESRIFNAMLRPADLPAGWREGGVGEENIENAVTRAYSFRKPVTANYSAVVSQLIIVYPSLDTAQNAYPDIEARWFPVSAWVTPTQLTYESATADQFRLSCIPVEINSVPAHSCRATGRYRDMVSVFLANVFEEQWFTWTDLEHVLQIIDERMAKETQ